MSSEAWTAVCVTEQDGEVIVCEMRERGVYMGDFDLEAKNLPALLSAIHDVVPEIVQRWMFGQGLKLSRETLEAAERGQDRRVNINEWIGDDPVITDELARAAGKKDTP